MAEHSISLASVYKGWGGYNSSLVAAIESLNATQLAFRASGNLRTAGGIAAHISLGRVGWFTRMGVDSARNVAQEVNPDASVGMNEDSTGLSQWFETTWSMISETLAAWDVTALARTYRHEFQGQTYSVSYQWTLWRVMAHDIHHGGELSMMLGMQGIPTPELGDLGGHITMPPLADA